MAIFEGLDFASRHAPVTRLTRSSPIHIRIEDRGHQSRFFSTCLMQRLYSKQTICGAFG
jgi:hypothetical protein